jgi:HK97 family phage prohead protease
MNNQQNSQMATPFKLEQRDAGDIRSVGEAGEFEGYVATFNTIDSYGSVIVPGAFSKTLEGRIEKIKLLWNHEQSTPIGKVIELREDETGLYIKGKLSLGVAKAAEVYELMKDGAINTMSFGFRAVKEKMVRGVRQITEVKLYEASPVVFAANEDAVITDVRNETNELEQTQEDIEVKQDELDNEEFRALKFSKTLADIDLQEKAWRLPHALVTTFADIWSADIENEQALTLIEKNIEAFKKTYMQFSRDFIDAYRTDGVKVSPGLMLMFSSQVVNAPELKEQQEETEQQDEQRGDDNALDVQAILTGLQNFKEEVISQ